LEADVSKLVNMKMPKVELEKRAERSTIATEGPRYPWGLSVNLESCCLKALGLEASDFTIGESKTLIARVEVTSISSNESQNSEPNQSVSLQITDLCIEDGDEASKAAKSLYKA
jgi:hypothetical protein